LAGQRWRRFAGADSLLDLIRFGLVLPIYVVVDQATQQMASLTATEVANPVLAVTAARANPLFFALLTGLLTVVAVAGRGRLHMGWADLDNGAVLRLFVAPIVFLHTWRAITLDVDFITGQWHTIDRLLLLGLAIALLRWPILLIPWILEARLLNVPLEAVSGALSSQNIDELLIVVLIAVSAAFILAAASGVTSAGPALALASAAVANHFFVAGFAKLRLGWFGQNQIADLPMGTYSNGWRAAGDGTWSQRTAAVFEPLNLPIRLITLAIEFGAIFAIVHYRLFRVWVLATPLFHAAIFVATGFWFGEWIVVELGVFWLYSTERFASTVRENATIARRLFCIVVVALPSFFVFHPPPLAWLDSPVSHGYRIEATNAKGQPVHVNLSAFAPFEQDLFFRYLDPDKIYGHDVLYNRDVFENLGTVRDFDDLEAIEAANVPSTEANAEATEAFFISFIEFTNNPIERPWFLIQPPPRFSTSRADPVMNTATTPLSEVRLVRVTRIHDQPDLGLREEQLLIVGLDTDGQGVVLERSYR
jgi:hypothetical protein